MNLRQILLNLDLAIMCEHRQIEKVMLNGREIPVIAALVQYLDGNPNAVQELKNWELVGKMNHEKMSCRELLQLIS